MISIPQCWTSSLVVSSLSLVLICAVAFSCVPLKFHVIKSSVEGRCLWTAIVLLIPLLIRKILDFTSKLWFDSRSRLSTGFEFTAKYSWQTIATFVLLIPFVIIYVQTSITSIIVSVVYLVQYMISIALSCSRTIDTLESSDTKFSRLNTLLSMTSIVLLGIVGNQRGTTSTLLIAYLLVALISVAVSIYQFHRNRQSIITEFDRMITLRSASSSVNSIRTVNPKRAFRDISTSNYLLKDSILRDRWISAHTNFILTTFIHAYYIIFSISYREVSWSNSYGFFCLNTFALCHTVIIMISSICKYRNYNQNATDWKTALTLNRQFARFVSHELRSPLNHIHLATQFIVEDISRVVLNSAKLEPSVNSLLKLKLKELLELQGSCESMLQILNEVMILDDIYERNFDSEMEMERSNDDSSSVRSSVPRMFNVKNNLSERSQTNLESVNSFVSEVFGAYQNGSEKQYMQNGVNVKVLVDTIPMGDDLVSSDRFNQPNTMLFVDVAAVRCVIKSLMSTAIGSTPTGRNVKINVMLLPDILLQSTMKVNHSLKRPSHSSFGSVAPSSFNMSAASSPTPSFLSYSATQPTVSEFSSSMEVVLSCESGESCTTPTSSLRTEKRDGSSRKLSPSKDILSFWKGKSRGNSNYGGIHKLSSSAKTKFGLLEGGILKIVIADEGEGLSVEDQLKLLKPNLSMAPDDLSCGQAAGLKLTIARAVVERHGGYFSIESEGIGKGCSYIIQLPYYLKQKTTELSLGNDLENNNSSNYMPDEVSIRSADPVSLRNISSSFGLDKNKIMDESMIKSEEKRVFMVVDDVLSCRKMLTKMIETLGHEVIGAKHGVEAIKQIQYAKQTDQKIDGIFMDCMMPCLDGPSAARQARALGFKGVIVGFTGISEADLARFYMAGANLVLEKPLRQDVITSVIADIISGKIMHESRMDVVTKESLVNRIHANNTPLSNATVERSTQSNNNNNNNNEQSHIVEINSQSMESSQHTTQEIIDKTNDSNTNTNTNTIRELHFLVVDDVPSNRKIVCRLLNRLGHTYEEASDGLQAVNAVTCRLIDRSTYTIDVSDEGGQPNNQHDDVINCKPSNCQNNTLSKTYKQFDGIIMDYVMPNMDGPSAALILRNDYRYSGIIIGVTGNVLSEDLMRFTSCGADYVVGKPLKADTFQSLISELFKNKRSSEETYNKN